MKYKKRQVRPAEAILKKIAGEYRAGAARQKLVREFNTTMRHVANAIRKYIPALDREKITKERRNAGVSKVRKLKAKNSVFEKARNNIVQIVGLYDGGMSCRRISERYSVSPCFLQKIIAGYQSRTNSGPREVPRSGSAKIALRLAACRPPDRVFWMCSSCGHTAEGDCPPGQCTKCNRGGFERCAIPQQLDIERLLAAAV